MSWDIEINQKTKDITLGGRKGTQVDINHSPIVERDGKKVLLSSNGKRLADIELDAVYAEVSDEAARLAKGTSYFANFERQEYLLNERLVTFDRVITFTRAGSATYIKNGRILTAGVDEPVFENGGLRIEPSRTNEVGNSKLGDYWTESAPHYPFDDEEFIVDTTSGFDGHTIRKFSLDKNGYLNVRRTSTSSSYLPMLPTVFVKSNLRYCRVVSSSQLSYSVVYDLQESTVIDIGGSIGFDPSIDSIGDGWRRISMISRPRGGGYISIIEVSSTDNFRDSNNLQTPDDYLMVFGLQQEDGGASLRTTSYIPTAGSTVTRPAEDFWIEDQAFQDIFNPNEGAVLIPHTSYGEGGIIALGSLEVVRTGSGLTINNTDIPNTEDAEINLGLRWGSNGVDVFVNGVKELSDVSLPVDWGDTDSLVLADSNGAGKYFNSLSVFTTAPPDSQMEVLTS